MRPNRASGLWVISVHVFPKVTWLFENRLCTRENTPNKQGVAAPAKRNIMPEENSTVWNIWPQPEPWVFVDVPIPNAKRQMEEWNKRQTRNTQPGIHGLHANTSHLGDPLNGFRQMASFRTLHIMIVLRRSEPVRLLKLVQSMVRCVSN